MQGKTAEKVILAGLLSGLLLLQACKSKEGASSKSYLGKEFTTESGLRYTIHKAGSGKRAASGDLVSVHYQGILTDSTEFDNSFTRAEPIKFTLGEGRVIKGWDEGIALLNVGDSASFIIPPELAYGSRSVGPIPPNSTLIFHVSLISASLPALPFDVSKLDTVVVQEGLKMIFVSRNDSGIQAENGKNIAVHYSGYLKNGKKFDSSVDRGTPFRFPLGQGRVIKGWDLGVLKMRTGEKARLIIDPSLAYGDKGMGSIPPNATLIFDVELLEVR